MAEIVRITYQFKRGTKMRWMEVNPILKQGEPGFEYDTGKLKIGDGFTPWSALPYISVGEGELVNIQTKGDLPLIGDSTKLYRVVDDKLLYQWNDFTWQPLGGSSTEISNINGGNANV